MRPAAVLSEAWRSTASGSNRAAGWGVLAVLVFGVVGAADARLVVGLLADARELRESGASVWVVEAPAGIDAARCEALADVEGVNASGALRESSVTVRPASLPSSEIRVVEATPGLGAVLAVEGPPEGGVWLPRALAETLGIASGGSIETVEGRVTVAGRYEYPADGRMTTLEHVVVAPVPATGAFDGCWAEVWPPSVETTALLSFALDDSTAGSQAQEGQLNARYGRLSDPAARYDERPTRWAGGVAVVAGAALGYASVRSRRLELASALHAGVPRGAVTAQVILETLSWSMVGAVMTVPLLWWASGAGSPGAESQTWMAAVLAVAGGALSTALGAFCGAVVTRESQLVRYFADR